ncbi:MAG TPA: hypothetical protein VLW50_21680 [Streptosporangiaceae bacterium]|nr:hypothetical protein [Streptosporangiaceae bacterium]
MRNLIEPLRVAPGSTVNLSRDHDPGYTGQVTRPEADALLARETNDWERYLVDNGIHFVKIVLNLPKGEQAKRFLGRIDQQGKNWKSRPATSGSAATGTSTSGPSPRC